MKQYSRVVYFYGSGSLKDAFEFCLERRKIAPGCHRTILERMHAKEPLDATYIEDVLVPVIPKLRILALQYNILDETLPHFKAVMIAWTEKVLIAKPHTDASHLIPSAYEFAGCCPNCTRVWRFFKSNLDKSIELSHIGAQRRKHLETKLARSTEHACTWDMIESKPQGIIVCLSSPLLPCVLLTFSFHYRSTKRVQSTKVYGGRYIKSGDTSFSRISARMTKSSKAS